MHQRLQCPVPGGEALDRLVLLPDPAPAPVPHLVGNEQYATARPPKRQHNSYDHRLRALVHSSGDLGLARQLGVPRSTASTWRDNQPTSVITLAEENTRELLAAENARLRAVNCRLRTICRVLLGCSRALGLHLERRRVDEYTQHALVRIIKQAHSTLPLKTVLAIVGLSSSRFYVWHRYQDRCQADEAATCLRRKPNQLSFEEVSTIREMVTSQSFRHVPTGKLAILAQRNGKVYASPTTWFRLVRQRGWRRPRTRVHPTSPTIGLRAQRANELWHVDTTVIKLLDGSKTYLHAVIDNFSRKILAWTLARSLQAASNAAVLRKAVTQAHAAQTPTVVVDGGVENFNGEVDQLVFGGVLRRMRAQSTELVFSNSMVEAFWRCLKHNWLYLNTLDTFPALDRLIDFFVREHNSVLPHSAFAGQTPDEIYFETGSAIPEQLEQAKVAARAARLAANRELNCQICPRTTPPASRPPPEPTAAEP